jgi:hypothetical protein
MQSYLSLEDTTCHETQPGSLAPWKPLGYTYCTQLECLASPRIVNYDTEWHIKHTAEKGMVNAMMDDRLKDRVKMSGKRMEEHVQIEQGSGRTLLSFI